MRTQLQLYPYKFHFGDVQKLTFGEVLFITGLLGHFSLWKTCDTLCVLGHASAVCGTAGRRLPTEHHIPVRLGSSPLVPWCLLLPWCLGARPPAGWRRTHFLATEIAWPYAAGFLAATEQLYNSLCLSVGLSVSQTFSHDDVNRIEAKPLKVESSDLECSLIWC